MMPFCNADAISYFIDKARECASSNPYESRAWLLAASSIAPTIFQIQVKNNLISIIILLRIFRSNLK